MAPPPRRSRSGKEADTAGAAAPAEEGDRALSSKVQRMRVRAPRLTVLARLRALLPPAAVDAAGLTRAGHAVYASDGRHQNGSSTA